MEHDLIQGIGNVFFNEIRSEVNNPPFMSVLADETIDCATHDKLSIIIRYIYEAETCDKFIGFYEVSDDKNAENLTDVMQLR